MSRERHPDDPNSPWWGEHRFRYDEVIRRLRPPARILDAACGTAFGSARLRQQGFDFVVGVDLAADALREVPISTRREVGRLLAGDVAGLPFRSGSFDAVVSFETLEHTPRYRETLAEFARVLGPAGTLYLSTPNRPVHSPGGVTNPFHTQEFDAAELRELLEAHFARVEVFGQDYVRWAGGGAGARMEELLLARGVRKLPLGVRNALLRLFGAPRLYPMPDEFRLTDEPAGLARSVTLFAVASGPGVGVG